MANLPQAFPMQPESAIASYDWQDIADKTGVMIFHLFAATDSATTNYGVMRNAPGSDPEGRDSSAEDTTLDFDMTPFISPVTIGAGDIYFNFTHACASPAGTGSHIVYCSFCKVSGATTTVIGTVQSPTNTSSNNSVFETRCLKLAITQQNFKAGEYMRIRVRVVTGGSGTYINALTFDPLNRDYQMTGGLATITAATNPTHFKVSVPFKIDL